MEFKPSYSKLGFPMIPESLRQQLFGDNNELSKLDYRLIKDEFPEYFKFPPNYEQIDPFDMVIPKLSLDEYIERIDSKYQEIKQELIDFASRNIPEKPSSREIIRESGWIRYKPIEQGNIFTLEDDQESKYQIESVEYPLERILIIDVETFVKSRTNAPVMAVCVSSEAWYFWFNPSVLKPSIPFSENLIPVGHNKIIINHNVKFDTSKFKETYEISNNNYYLDTLSMHVAICGMSTKQRLAYKAHRSGKEVGASKWANKTSENSLVEVYNHHVNPLQKLKSKDKKTRTIFENANHHQEFYKKLDELIYYTLSDGQITYDLAKVLIPKYFRYQPSSITLGGHLELNKCILPIIDNWYQHLQDIEQVYVQTVKENEENLYKLAKDLVDSFMEGSLTKEQIEKDPFYSQLSWKPAKTGKNKGYPEWWRKTKNISTKSDLAPILLRMRWRGSPLYKSKDKGWVYPSDESSTNPIWIEDGKIPSGWYSRVPHKDGDNANCGNPLGKDYIACMERGDLSSDDPQCKDFLEKAKSVAYWVAIRKRALSYHPHKGKMPNGQTVNLIEPDLLVHGTASRRMVESLWLTVSSTKPNIIGSEIKGLVRPPKGYKFVGSDFDSQEMKIAAYFSDALKWGEFGSTQMGYTTIMGDKSQGTDSHTLLSKQSDLPRDVAKKLNFQMLYLSGVKGCASTIKQYRPDLSDDECRNLAKKVMEIRQGKKTYKNGNVHYYGGSDSEAYNLMIRICNRLPLPYHLKHLSASDTARLPISKAAISDAISVDSCGSEYLTSRANWTIQSTGVDILHLFTVILKDLYEYHNIDGFLVLPIHDELWTCIDENQVDIAAWCFQIAHLYTWAILAKQLNFTNLPWHYLFFSEVNIDNCLRKEVNQSQYSPSNTQDKVENGYTI